jgi:MFS family permease
MSIGLILGPVLGGIIYARCGYYAAFGLSFGFIGLDLVLRVILVEKKIAVRYIGPSLRTDDQNPEAVKLQSLQGGAPAIQETPEAQLDVRPPSPELNNWQSRIPPIIRILKYPRLLVALFLSFVQALILSAFDATLPLYLNALFGYTALQAGVISPWLD